MPKRRTPAHERAVRHGQLAQHEAHTLGAKYAAEHEMNAVLHERVRISNLRGDVAVARAELAEKLIDETLTAFSYVPGLGTREMLPNVTKDLLDSVIERAETAERREAGLQQMLVDAGKPIPMRLVCPSCGELHVDEGEFATKPHRVHACQHCGECWMPCLHTTVGVRFLPGTKNRAP